MTSNDCDNTHRYQADEIPNPKRAVNQIQLYKNPNDGTDAKCDQYKSREFELYLFHPDLTSFLAQLKTETTKAALI